MLFFEAVDLPKFSMMNCLQESRSYFRTYFKITLITVLSNSLQKPPLSP